MKKIKEKHYSFSHKPTGYKKKVIQKTFLLPDGRSYTSFIERTTDSVNIFPMTEDGQVVLVKQFRPGSEQIEMELPGGMIDPGEKPFRAAERELLEETGYEGNIEFLSARSYSPYSEGKRYVYIATGCKLVSEQDLDADEFVDVAVVNIEDLENLLYDGKIRNPDGAYMALHHLGLLKIRF
jgi:ADP-ribose pyrophosphatase